MTTIEGTVRIPPYRFDEPLEDVAIETLNEEYVGQLDKNLGLMVGAVSIEDIGEGVLIMGDGAAYHNVVFNAIFFKPEQQEIVEGEVTDITEFGAFVRIGPMEGLVHVSQVTDDYINYDSRNASLLGNESGKILTEGDRIRARIVTLSLKGKSIKESARIVTLSLKGKSIKESKIGLTMRQPNLGKFEWIQSEKNKAQEKANAKVEE